MNKYHPKQIHVIGNKNSGKTRLMNFLINEISEYGYKVGALKHTMHPHPLDKEGTDSDSFTKSGANPSVFYTSKGMSIVVPTDKSNDELIKYIYRDCDLLLVESFREAPFDKIIINPAEVECNFNNIVAVITKNGLHSDYSSFKSDDKDLVQFIINKYLTD